VGFSAALVVEYDKRDVVSKKATKSTETNSMDRFFEVFA
jgi:hypothetical protein